MSIFKNKWLYLNDYILKETCGLSDSLGKKENSRQKVTIFYNCEC